MSRVEPKDPPQEKRQSTQGRQPPPPTRTPGRAGGDVREVEQALRKH
jgi:hypothetical protein